MSIMSYYGQYGQDEFLFKNYFEKLKDHKGFFLDVGAMEGRHCSNSKFFEDQLGWSGILVEPNPNIIPTLKENRSKGSWEILEKAVVPNNCNDSEVPFYAMEDSYGMGYSGRTECYDSQHYERVKREHQQGLVKCFPPKTINVPTVKIDALLEGIETVDIMSLDTEGGELDLLKSINFDDTYIKTMTVENNSGDPRFRYFMESKGFTHVADLGCDQLFVNKKFEEEIS